ncbi:SDR family NAD(P)-dependent oxidoreductase [Thalassotalea sp. PLHSN55]|uniref:SDR family NAD(P)-dependent oxidoreductase n=1 Tax=Thalassotalea sp. PLHSN55 TaxID=3435888 RepID=UPI003F863E0E
MFKNKHIIITGGSSGLGLAVASLLVKQGAHLSLIARNLSKLEAAKSQLLQQNPKANIQIASLDVNNSEASQNAFTELAQPFGGIDMLINSAGVLKVGRFEDFQLQDFRDVMETNYFGLVSATQAALPFLKIRQGKVVNIASIAGLVGTFGYSPYNASKYAVVGLSEAMRYELKPQGVDVQLICPGEFDTPMVQNIANQRPVENIAHAQTIPPMTVEQVAKDVVKGIASSNFTTIPGFIAKITVAAIRHFPALGRWIGDRVIAKAQRNKL